MTEQSHLGTLSDAVRQLTFADAGNVSSDSVFLGPPTVEFAPYSRVPVSKHRNDARQGLIDQDPEFIEFLESLTNPPPKRFTADGLPIEVTLAYKEETATVTPLIQYLRDKRAAKEKALPSKTTKHTRQGSKNEANDIKGDQKAAAQISDTTTDPAEKTTGRSNKVEKTAKDGSKETKTVMPSSSSKPPISSPTTSEKRKPAPKFASPLTSAASIIQRDLGITGHQGIARRGGRAILETKRHTAATGTPNANTNGTPVKPSSVQSTPVAAAIATTPPEQSVIKPPTGPAAILRRTNHAKLQANVPASITATAAPKVPTQPPAHNMAATSLAVAKAAAAAPALSTGTHAFLKHANPSQGITEPLIGEALLPYGVTTKVEIDKRKGFAYVEFAEPEGLRKAIAAGSIKVAQGSVQVLERKDRPPTRSIGAVRGGSMGGRGPLPTGPAFRGARGGRGRGGLGRGEGTVTAAPVGAQGGTVLSPPTVPTPTTSTATPVDAH